MRRSTSFLCLVGAGAFVAGPLVAGNPAAAADPGTPVVGTPPLVRFVDSLPVLPDIPVGASSTLYEVAGRHTFGHRVTGKTAVTAPSFAYSPFPTRSRGNLAAFPNGPYLGPSLEVQKGTQLKLKIVNQLTGTHPMASHFDNTIMGANGKPADPNSIQTAVHLHGGHTVVTSDGGPTDVFGPGQSVTNTYANDQEATQLWFHDHAMGLTRFNLMTGLVGNYLIRDQWDTGRKGNAVKLPYGHPGAAPANYGNDSGGRPYEMPLVVQDRMFNAAGSALNYPVQKTAFHPVWAPESFGDTPVINGQAYPNDRVDKAVYRFRIVNSSNARFYNLTLVPANKGNPANVPMYQIGSEGGLLNAPVRIGGTRQKSILIAPSERADVLIDFTKVPAGAKYQFANDAAAPYPSGTTSSVPRLMQFTVNAAKPTADAVTAVPTVLRSSAAGSTLPPAIAPAAVGVGATGLGAKVSNTRVVYLNEAHDPAGLPTRVMLNNLSFDSTIAAIRQANGNRAPAGIASPEVNTVEEWDIVNTSDDAHPIHLHVTQFQVLNRQSINSAKYLAAVNALLPLDTANGVPGGTPVAGTGVRNAGVNSVAPNPAAYLTGKISPPDPTETGWTDTVKAYPGSVTRILVPFGGTNAGIPAAFAGDPTGGPYQFVTGPGQFYVWHCHILEHEDNDMMQAYQIVPPKSGTSKRPDNSS
jgi:spore coat protein A